MTPLQFLPERNRQVILKLAEDKQESGGPSLSSPAVRKEIAKVVGTVGLGTALGYAGGRLTGQAVKHFGLLDNIPAQYVAKAMGAVAAVSPVLYKMKDQLALTKIREAYERERAEKRKQLPGTR